MGLGDERADETKVPYLTRGSGLAAMPTGKSGWPSGRERLRYLCGQQDLIHAAVLPCRVATCDCQLSMAAGSGRALVPSLGVGIFRLVFHEDATENTSLIGTA